MRNPYKVYTALYAQMIELRAEGKAYAVIGGLLGISPECARKWLTGITPTIHPQKRSS